MAEWQQRQRGRTSDTPRAAAVCRSLSNRCLQNHCRPPLPRSPPCLACRYGAGVALAVPLYVITFQRRVLFNEPDDRNRHLVWTWVAAPAVAAAAMAVLAGATNEVALASVGAFGFGARTIYLLALSLGLLLALLFITGHSTRVKFDVASWALAFPLEALVSLSRHSAVALASCLFLHRRLAIRSPAARRPPHVHPPLTSFVCPPTLAAGHHHAAVRGRGARRAAQRHGLRRTGHLLVGGRRAGAADALHAGDGRHLCAGALSLAAALCAGCLPGSQLQPFVCCCTGAWCLPASCRTRRARSSQAASVLPPLTTLAGPQVRPALPADPHPRGLPRRRRQAQGGGRRAGRRQGWRHQRPRARRLCAPVPPVPPGARVARAPGGQRHFQGV